MATMAEERMIVAVAAQIATAMKAAGVRRSELAKRLKITKGRVSHFLRGKNLTLRTMVNIFAALDCEVIIRTVPDRVDPTS